MCGHSLAEWPRHLQLTHPTPLGKMLYGSHTVTALNDFFYLAKLEFNGRRPPKDRDHHLEGLAFLIDLVDYAVEIGEGTVGDADGFVLLELDLHPRLVFGDVGTEEDRTDFL